jgi:hypothetical protein
MKIIKGFRIPEPSERAIRWPSIGGDDPRIAVWMKNPAAWSVNGFDRAWGDPFELISHFGNDWFAVSLDAVPEPPK